MSKNILYLGTLNGVQLDFETGNFVDIGGISGDVANFVITQTLDASSTSGQAPSAETTYDFVTGVSGFLAENSNDTLYDLTVQAGTDTNTSVIRLSGYNTSDDASNPDDVVITGGQDITITEAGNTITIAHSDTSAASSSSNSNGTVVQSVGIDGQGHVTSFGTTNLDSRYYTESEVDNIINPISGTAQSGYDNSITGVDFNTSNGNLTLQQQDGGTIVESLDGRYLTSYTETQTLDDVVALGSTTDEGITVRSVSIADGTDGAAEISATAGNLTLDSVGGSVIVDDDLIVNSNATIVGNLLVSGTTTTVESAVTVIHDPVLTLGSGTIAADDGKDRGIEFVYYDGALRTGFFGYDNEDSRFAFFTGATNTSENFVGVAAPFDLSATVDDSTIEYVDGSSYLQVKDGGISNAQIAAGAAIDVTKLSASGVTVTAGNGLTDGGLVNLGESITVNVGAGNGITVAADSVSVDGHNGITVDGNGVSTNSDQSHLNKIDVGADQTNVGSGTNTTYGGVKVVRARGTSATAVDLTEAGTAGDAIAIAADSTLTFEGVVGVRNEDTDSANGAESAAWKIMGVLERDSDSVNMVLSQVTVIAKGANATNWSISLSAGTAGLQIQGNGEAGHNLVWSATLNYNVITA